MQKISLQECLSDISKRCIGLKQGADAFFEERNLTSEIVEKFQLGFFPLDFKNFLERYPLNLLLELKLVFLHEKTLYCPFSGRIVFPVQDPYGQVVALFGRTLKQDKIKYINTDYAKKSYLYGLNFSVDAIRDKDKVYVVEGNVCVMTAWKNGIKNIVASCGSHPSQEQVDTLARYASVITFVPDMDEAGLIAFKRTLQKRGRYNTIFKWIKLSFGKDLDEYLQKYSSADFYELEKEEKKDKLVERMKVLL